MPPLLPLLKALPSLLPFLIALFTGRTSSNPSSTGLNMKDVIVVVIVLGSVMVGTYLYLQVQDYQEALTRVSSIAHDKNSNTNVTVQLGENFQACESKVTDLRDLLVTVESELTETKIENKRLERDLAMCAPAKVVVPTEPKSAPRKIIKKTAIPEEDFEGLLRDIRRIEGEN